MKIWHPNIMGLHGGPRTFMTYFDEIAHKTEVVKIVSRVYQADVIIGLNDWIPIDTIHKAKKINIPYLHRANGVFRPDLKDFPDWKERNAKLRPHYRAADKVIFQSVFAKESYFEYVCERGGWRVIHNGVDTEKFHPKYRTNPTKVGILGRELTKEQGEFRKRFMKECSYPVEEIKDYWNKNFVDVYSEIKVAILPDEHACCPNQVLECMAMGIPVLVWKGGGAEELVPPTLAVKPYTAFPAIQELWENNEGYSEMVRGKVVKEFEIKDVIGKYLEELRTLCE